MIFFAEVKLRAFLISSGATFQSLVDEPIKLFLEKLFDKVQFKE
jgi:hypothetical protein